MAKEHPVEGLEREIEEETGFIVSIDYPLKVKTDRETGRLDLSYVGTFCGGEFRQSEEVYGYGFFAFDELPFIMKKQLLLIKEAYDLRKEGIPVQKRKFFPSSLSTKVMQYFNKN
jgi:8-oxo-dGTP pyrophosphatase MutT (NUDIX family)